MILDVCVLYCFVIGVSELRNLGYMMCLGYFGWVDIFDML